MATRQRSPKGDGRAGNRNAVKKINEGLGPAPWDLYEETDRAERCIRFIEEEIVLPKGYGAGERMRLAEYQKSFIRDIFKPGVRAATLSVPRGGGKSTLLAAIALYCLFDKQASLGGQPQIPVCAVTYQQAMRAVFLVAVEMVKANPNLEERALIYSGIGTTKIRCVPTGGEMFPLAVSDPSAAQGYDPGPIAIVDEIGHIDPASYQAVLLASGKRPGTVVVAIGTAGPSKENNALWDLRQKIANGVDIPGHVYVEYSAPDGWDPYDEKTWYAAQPALAEGFLDIEAYRMAAKLSPEAEFTVYRLNKFTDNLDSWLGPNGLTIWRGLTDPYPLVPGAKTWGGLDVGLRHDSTALVLVQERPDGRHHAVAKIWFPTTTEVVDLHDVAGYIREVCERYDVEAIAYDPRLVEYMATELADEGYPMVEIPQSVERLTPMVGELFKAIKEGRITHDGDEAFQTQVLNAVPRLNQRGFTLAKHGKTKGKIDAAVALALAYDRARHKEKPRPKAVVLW